MDNTHKWYTEKNSVYNLLDVLNLRIESLVISENIAVWHLSFQIFSVCFVLQHYILCSLSSNLILLLVLSNVQLATKKLSNFCIFMYISYRLFQMFIAVLIVLLQGHMSGLLSTLLTVSVCVWWPHIWDWLCSLCLSRWLFFLGSDTFTGS